MHTLHTWKSYYYCYHVCVLRPFCSAIEMVLLKYEENQTRNSSSRSTQSSNDKVRFVRTSTAFRVRERETKLNNNKRRRRWNGRRKKFSTHMHMHMHTIFAYKTPSDAFYYCGWRHCVFVMWLFAVWFESEWKCTIEQRQYLSACKYWATTTDGHIALRSPPCYRCTTN